MVTQALIQVPCPICSSHSYTLRHRVQQWCIVQCNQCAMVYTNPRLSNKAIIQLYTSNYFNNTAYGYSNYTENPHLKRLNFKRWIQAALPYLPKQNGLLALDVGCAAGYAFDTYKAHHITVAGVEMDMGYHASLTAQGYNIYASTILELNTTLQYHIITLFDVVEHLTHVHDNFAKLHTLLAPNGLLVIVTPNYNSMQRKVVGKHWFQFKPIEHINYFTLSSLTAVAAQHGFKLVHSTSSGQYADAQFVTSRLQKYNYGILKVIMWPVLAILKLFKQPIYLDSASIYCVYKKL